VERKLGHQQGHLKSRLLQNTLTSPSSLVDKNFSGIKAGGNWSIGGAKGNILSSQLQRRHLVKASLKNEPSHREIGNYLTGKPGSSLQKSRSGSQKKQVKENGGGRDAWGSRETKEGRNQGWEGKTLKPLSGQGGVGRSLKQGWGKRATCLRGSGPRRNTISSETNRKRIKSSRNNLSLPNIGAGVRFSVGPIITGGASGAHQQLK